MNPTPSTPPVILLTAQTFDLDTAARTIRGKITVFGVNAEDRGMVLEAACLEPRQPLRRVKMLRDHDMAQPVGYMTEFTQTDTEAHATFTIPEGPDGDRALLEASNGLRDGLSVGILPFSDGYSFDEEWNLRITRAELYEVSLCAIPAFQDAQVESVAAAVAFARQQTRNTVEDETPTPPAAPAPVALEATPDRRPTPAVPAVPQSSFARAGSGVQLTARQQFMAAIAENSSIQLALDPIIQADVFDEVTVPAYLGELWAGRSYFQRFAPLISSAPLTSQEMTGWRWVQTPGVFDYAGNLVEVGTNPVSAEAVPFKAARTASGHKVDRIHVDMPNPAFWDSFYRERANNYARLIDAKVLTHLLAAENSTTANVAAGVTDPFHKLIVGAQAVLEFAVPDFAIVGADLYLQMALTTDQDKLGFLSASLGLEEGSLAGFRIVGAPPSRTDLNGKIIVGAAASTTLYELPGGPIRVEALDVAHAGVDAGLYGYHALFTTDKRGIVSVGNAA